MAILPTKQRITSDLKTSRGHLEYNFRKVVAIQMDTDHNHETPRLHKKKKEGK
jgi:hypothetical protein